ncbi:MAG: hypothetical protein H0A76_12890 [Candidatus Thiodubiliella endoseptemdiera]|uniref:Uncharacterized protein n=1 Tax=Candidatus Thiodubiliella endoseptemdiera TaxID=2738886 RepID=A0A853F949_9GAMM|nr:hypothetical protein [Candidatus Thiodubiliella endoseptemdiera]
MRDIVAGDDKYGDNRDFDRKVHSQGLKRYFYMHNLINFTNPTTDTIEGESPHCPLN